MSTKKLYRVAVQGEVWVMATSPQAAREEAIYRTADEADNFEIYVYPRVPVDPSLLKEDVLTSLPWNADEGDERTIRDHIRDCGRAQPIKEAK